MSQLSHFSSASSSSPLGLRQPRKQAEAMGLDVPSLQTKKENFLRVGVATSSKS